MTSVSFRGKQAFQAQQIHRMHSFFLVAGVPKLVVAIHATVLASFYTREVRERHRSGAPNLKRAARDLQVASFR